MGMSVAAARASCSDILSVSVRDQLRAQWRDVIKRQSPAQRESWLGSQEGIVALGARECLQLLKSIKRDRLRASRVVCSMAWFDAIFHGGHRLPQGEVGRWRGVRLQLSRELVRIGEEGEAHRRWTPPQCVDLEDMLDGMSAVRASFYEFPASPSAIAIRQIEASRGKETRNRLHH